LLYDLIVVGKGPAGISAALYVRRAGFSVLVIGKEMGSLEKSEKIENYYGFPEGISGKELVQSGIAQAKNLGVEVKTAEVLSVAKEKDFSVGTTGGSFAGKAVLLATGKPRQGLKIEGFEEFKGRGISFCAVCDGFFYRKKRLAVIGSGDYAISELHELLAFSQDIALFTNGQVLKSPDKVPEGVTVVTGKILKIEGKDKVEKIVTEAGSFDADGIFVAVGTASSSDFARKIGVLLEKDTIVVNEDFETNVEGLFAAGDCVGGFLQIAKSVSDGAHASRGIVRFLKSK